MKRRPRNRPKNRRNFAVEQESLLVKRKNAPEETKNEAAEENAQQQQQQLILPSDALYPLTQPPRHYKKQKLMLNDESDDSGEKGNEQETPIQTTANDNHSDESDFQPPPQPHQQQQQQQQQVLEEEEELRLLEASLRVLQSRRQLLDEQEQQSHVRRKDYMQTIADAMQRRVQLEISRNSQARLLENLELSLTKSRDLLQRKQDTTTTTTTNEDDNDDDTNGDSTDGEIMNSRNKKERPTTIIGNNDDTGDIATTDDQSEQSRIEVEVPPQNTTTTTATNDEDDEQQQSLASFRQCPVPSSWNVVQIQNFWKGHTPPTARTRQPLYLFNPCISSPTTITTMMNITAREALGRQCQQQQQRQEQQQQQLGNDLTTAVAEFRRQSLWNTCLDFMGMMMGNNNNNNNNNNRNNNNTNGAGGSDNANTNNADKNVSNETMSSMRDAYATPIEQNNDQGDEDIQMTENNIDTSQNNDQQQQQLTDESKTNNDDDDNNNKNDNHVDPNVALCPYELGGVCADPFCPYQHLNNLQDRPIATSILPREFLPLPELRLPETPGGWEITTTTTTTPAKTDINNKPEMGKNTVAITQEEHDSKSSSPLGTTATAAVAETCKASDDNAQLNSTDPSAGNRASDMEENRQNLKDTMHDFETNADFIALNNLDSDDSSSNDDDDEEEDDEADFMNLETAGLVGFTTNSSNLWPTGRGLVSPRPTP